MDVTPTPAMLRAMQAFVNATIGDAPGSHETTTPANNRRAARENAMQFLHNLVRLSMREGVARDRRAAHQERRTRARRRR
jgi:hypothetical protein